MFKKILKYVLFPFVHTEGYYGILIFSVVAFSLGEEVDIILVIFATIIFYFTHIIIFFLHKAWITTFRYFKK